MQAVVRVQRSHSIGSLDPNIFGQYIEHVEPHENCIYGGLMDEESPLSDANGLRTDVMAACRELQVPVVRWPGGCFADVYHWPDGVGPREQRPARRNWHWGGLEPNHFGTDEFLTWCEQVGCVPYINVNLGTGSLLETLRWLDYCNGAAPTDDVMARQKHGRMQPYNVPFWGIGNEQWGSWEAGHMDAQEYAKRLANWGIFLKKADPSIHLLGVGSHDGNNPNWDLAVLRAAGNLIDYLTIHSYAHTIAENTSTQEYYAVVGSALLFEERLLRAWSTIETAMPDGRRGKPVRIALDEWNIRHLVRQENCRFSLSRKSPRTLRDAIFAAGVFHAMMRLAPYVGMACYVFLVNGNGVLLANADGLVRTPLYEVFRVYRQCMAGTVVETAVETPSAQHALRTNHGETLDTFREIPYIDAISAFDDAAQTLSIAIINRHVTEEISVRLFADGIENTVPIKAFELYHDDLVALNDWETPDRVCLQELAFTQPCAALNLKPHSITMLQYSTR
jgi:alpha-N-arabinofuranosidase